MPGDDPATNHEDSSSWGSPTAAGPQHTGAPPPQATGRARALAARVLEDWLLGSEPTGGSSRSASAGIALLVLVGVIVGVTLPLLTPTAGAWWVLGGYAVAAAVAWACVRRSWWARLPGAVALLFPALVFGLTGMVATVSPHSGVAYAAFFTLGFAWTGLFASGASGRWLLLLALPAYAQTLPAEVEFTRPAAARLVLLTCLWLALSEVLAALRARELTRQQTLRRASETDPLTGLGNRRAIQAQLEALRPGDCVALLDLDDFKHLNDTRGHAAGDQLLTDLAAALHGGLRAGDGAARWGGEEFLLVLPRTDHDEALAVVDRIRVRWAQERTTTFSAGVGSWPRTSTAPTTTAPAPVSATQLIHAADLALYAAKRAGKNRVR